MQMRLVSEIKLDDIRLSEPEREFLLQISRRLNGFQANQNSLPQEYLELHRRHWRDADGDY